MRSVHRATAALLGLGLASTSVIAQGLPSDVEQQLGLRPGQALPSDLEQRGVPPGAPLPSDVEQQLRRQRDRQHQSRYDDGMTSSATAEMWTVREGRCGEWQSRWNIEQDRSGVWVGTIEHFQIGGPCVPRTGETHRSEVRAVIAGENFFAFNTMDNGGLCSYVARIVRENRARGVSLCEGNPERGGFVIRFRSPQDTRSMREVPPDDDLLTEDQRRHPELRFEFRGLEQLFGR